MGFLSTITQFVNKHDSKILLYIGIAGVVTAPIMAVTATPKAYRDITEEKIKTRTEKLTKRRTFKLCWKYYVAPTLVLAGSITAICLSARIESVQKAAIASAYGAATQTLKEYQQKVVENVGEKQEQKIRHEVTQDQAQKVTIDKNITIPRAGNGNTLCIDLFSGRPFYSDIEYLRKKINDVNQRLFHEHSLTLNDWYYELRLDGIPIGYKYGWSIIEGQSLEVDFDTVLSSDGTPALTVHFDVYQL